MVAELVCRLPAFELLERSDLVRLTEDKDKKIGGVST